MFFSPPKSSTVYGSAAAPLQYIPTVYHSTRYLISKFNKYEFIYKYYFIIFYLLFALLLLFDVIITVTSTSAVAPASPAYRRIGL